MSGNDLVPQNDAPAPQVQFRMGGRQTRYLAQSVVLEEAGASNLIRAGLITVGAVIVAFLGWAAITEVDEVAQTFGEVVPAGQVQMIQHLEGGLLQEVLVEEGDTVQPGQILARMDPSAALAELEQMKARRAGLILRAERLRAFGLDQEPDFDIVDPRFADLIDDQQTIYDVQLNSLESRRDVAVNQIAQARADLTLFDEQQQTMEEHLVIVEEELEIRKELFEKGLSSKIVYLDLQREANRARGDIAEVLAERRKASEGLSEARNRLIETEATLREEALREMGTVTAELAQVREAMARLEDRVSRLEVRAPVRGIVKGIQQQTAGAVLAPGDEMMEVVPLDKELLVETRVTTRDVGHLQEGQPVTVKIITFDFARYGGISGELRKISASTFLDEQQEPYYKALVSLDRSYVGFDPQQNRVLPGMTVQADVTTGKKTLLQYLLKPVYSSVNTAFRER